jgi:hypothetical protein
VLAATFVVPLRAFVDAISSFGEDENWAWHGRGVTPGEIMADVAA